MVKQERGTVFNISFAKTALLRNTILVPCYCDGVGGVATPKGWTVRGSNPSRVKISRAHPDRYEAGPLSLLQKGYRVFPRT